MTDGFWVQALGQESRNLNSPEEWIECGKKGKGRSEKEEKFLE